jgi:hypothetical protein
MRNKILFTLAILSCIAIPTFAQDPSETRGPGAPTAQSPVPDCIQFKKYRDTLTGDLWQSSGLPCTWVKPGGGGTAVQPFGTVNYGDSTIYGIGSSTPAYVFGQQLKLYIPGQWQNFAVSGAYSEDIAGQVWRTWTPQNNFAMPYVHYESGINDANIIGNTTGGVNNATLATMAGLRHVAIPIANQSMASTCSNSGWSAYTNSSNLLLPSVPGTATAFLNGTMMQTSTNGATLTCTITTGASGKIGVTWLGNDAATGTFTISVNGTLQTSLCSGTTTFSQGGCNGQTISRNGGFSPFAQEFSGTANASNTVVITATNTGLNLMMDVDAMPTSTATAPIVGVQGVLYQQADASSAATAAYNTVMSNLATALHSEDANVVFVDVRGGTPGVNAGSDFGGTGCAGGVAPLHPADCGYQNLALTTINALTSAGMKVGAANLGTQLQTNFGVVLNWTATLPSATATNPYVNDWQSNPGNLNSTTQKMPGWCLYWTGTVCNGRIAYEYSTTLSSFGIKVMAAFPTVMCGISVSALDNNCGFVFWNGSVGQGSIAPLHIGWTGNYNSPTSTNGFSLSLDSQKAVTTGTTNISQTVMYVGPGTYSPQQCTSALNNWIQFYWTTSGGSFTFSKTFAGDTINGAASITFPYAPANSLFIAQCSISAAAGITISLIPVNTGTLYSAAGTALPACSSTNKNQRETVTDATAPTFLGTYTSGGAVFAPVVCNGTNWVTF